jgi:hypothetical protein
MLRLERVAVVFLLGCQAAAPPKTPASTAADTFDPYELSVQQPLVLPKEVAPPTPVPTPEPKPSPSKVAIEQLLAGGSPALKAVMASPEQYRFQVLYSAVRDDRLERHAYRPDAEYYFPASSMKVPIALASYERLALLRKTKPQVTRDATLRIHPTTGNAEPYVTTLARETWRALIVSDNFSANRLIGFVGHRELHETLWGLGLPSTRVHSGFATGAEIDDAEVSPRIEVTQEGAVVTDVAARKSTLVLPATNATGLEIGEAVVVDGRRVPGALSFAKKNAIRLTELQDTLVRIMRPELLPKGAAPGVASQEDMAYLRQALGTLPSESGLAGFDRNVVMDYQLSPFLRGLERVRARGRFLLYSKVGQAFGFLVANAYVVDKETGRSFFLTACVFANPDGTMNDDRYAYDTISFPALADVAEAIYRHALAS